MDSRRHEMLSSISCAAKPQIQDANNAHLTEQLYAYWAESQHLRNRVHLLQAQLESSHGQLVKCHQSYSMKCHEYGQVVSELAQLREQFKRLNEMLSGGRHNLQGPVPVFLQLEARHRSVQQAEIKISQRATALKVACQGLQNELSEIMASVSGNSTGTSDLHTN
ncbi:uncharacterized protein BP01DRAFT_330595 [Aspergillus saccharolyticus JOP 1030-1]|uniref:Uncharacterized protein n=1 Tax=Aspergillus saccharolyticus JOP 1030-1 TaxID=1450539 RepID=A0A318Z131_9EURO|nr:hypothetical protein BP01DRAFT_330595 [Aspergillus saccharolyticus JOP 1030-1]PYH40084.1 hypothetical protein BP01DRAFT_330595 [Aspergillus saccharolyticus JOP 1030-1]